MSSLCPRNGVTRGRDEDSELYTRLILPQGRGYPLWRPALSLSYPAEYLESGIRIGDVGYISTFGDFHFQFNICLPPEHPVNRGCCPKGFRPIDSGDPVVSERIPSEMVMSDLVKGKMETRQLSSHGEEIHYHLECQGAEGAALMLPEGAYREDLKNTSAFRHYAALNAESWYRHVNYHEDGKLVNGSLHLVTGYDKTAAYAAAVFSPSVTTAINELKLDLTATTNITSHGSETRRTYQWREDGLGNTRYMEKSISSEVNQCVFLRSLCVRLGHVAWGKRSKATSRKGFGWLHDYISLWHPEEEFTPYLQLESDSPHPSRIITNYLLQKVPRAKIAIVHYNNWRTLTNEGEPEPQDLCEVARRLEMRYMIVFEEETKAVFLKDKDILDGVEVNMEEKKGRIPTTNGFSRIRDGYLELKDT